MERGGPVDGRISGIVWLSIVIAIVAMLATDLGLSPSVCYDVAWTAAASAALIGMIVARRGALPGNRVRWTLWAMAAGAWLFGQLAWDVFGLAGYPASPNVADLGWWLFALIIMASMLRLPEGPRTVRLVTAVESVPLVFAAVALCVGELWATTMHSHLGLAPKVSALIYPALYVSATIITVQAMLAGSLRGCRTVALRLVLIGIGAQAMGFILWSSELLQGTYVPGKTLLDPLWVVGLVAMAVGGLMAAQSPEDVPRLEEPTHLGVILPAGVFLLIFLALVIAVFTGVPGPNGSMVLRVGLLCSGAALIARSTLLGRRLQVLLNREREALGSLAERETELARLNQQLVEDSRRDPLTGIGNRRALSDDLAMFESRQRENGELVAVALCDVDHFKAYNDRLGHLAGDGALRMIAATARGALRAGDTAYRFGGEELLLVLRDLSQEDALNVAERVRMAVQAAAFVHPDGEGGVLTVSIGVACGEGDVAELLNRADAALYEAKRSGRNRVIAADATIVAGPTRQRDGADESPVPRHLRSMLAVSRAAAAGQGQMPVVDALAEAIRSEMSFHVVVVNLAEPEIEQLRVVVVVGNPEARATLLGTTLALNEWERLLGEGMNVHGASWLPAGSYEWQPGDGAVWTPTGEPAAVADAWNPEDMLLLPLRGADGELLGVVSVDEPMLGRRPSEDEIGVLMAVADHAGLALDQVQREATSAQDGSAELRLAAAMLLAETLDLRDPSTALHSRTVGQLCRMVAVALDLPDQRVDRIHAAGVLHDLGKLGIADAILQKAGPLDEAEWREIRAHPEVGSRILENAGMHDIAGWVRCHHERVDGKGYPDGVVGERIPLESRILAVADAFEAMIAERPYGGSISREEACAELERCAGTQFDPYIVRVFLTALDDEQATAPLRALEQVA